MLLKVKAYFKPLFNCMVSMSFFSAEEEQSHLDQLNGILNDSCSSIHFASSFTPNDGINHEPSPKENNFLDNDYAHSLGQQFSFAHP